MSARRVVEVFVSGRVQGVGYRDWTVAAALKNGLRGWVRNRRDGRVEAVFAGPAEDVARMIEACRAGPPSARVDALHLTEFAPETEGELMPGFRRLPTA